MKYLTKHILSSCSLTIGYKRIDNGSWKLGFGTWLMAMGYEFVASFN